MQEAIGELVGAAKEGLLALSVGVGLGVLSSMMEEEVDDVVGPKGRHNADGLLFVMATRMGRSRSAADASRSGARGCGPPMASTSWRFRCYEHFADRDPLQRVVLERMLAGVSTRRYRRTQEPVGEEI